MYNVLVLGCNGFLAQGLMHELDFMGIKHVGVDVNDVDLAKNEAKEYLVKNCLESTTHIVLLAASVGIETFNDNESALKAYQNNTAIVDNVYAALKEAAAKYNKKYNVVFYSTSEVYGSKNGIMHDKSISINTSSTRSLYALNKLYGEMLFKSMCGNELKSLVIARPFNVFGKFQKRGVIYDMAKSLVNTGKVYYRKDTYRTFTSLSYASRTVAELISSSIDGVVVKDIVEYENCFSLEAVAIELAKQYLNIGNQDEGLDDARRYAVKSLLVEIEPDPFLKNRVYYNYCNNTFGMSNHFKMQLREMIETCKQYGVKND